MWYFTWILGVLLACAFGLINALWLEVTEGFERAPDAAGTGGGSTRGDPNSD